MILDKDEKGEPIFINLGKWSAFKKFTIQIVSGGFMIFAMVNFVDFIYSL